MIENNNNINNKDIYRDKIKGKSNSKLTKLIIIVIAIITIIVLLSMIYIGTLLLPKSNAEKTSNEKLNSKIIKITNTKSNTESTKKEESNFTLLNDKTVLNINQNNSKSEITTEEIANNMIPSIVGILSTYTPKDSIKSEESATASGIIMSDDGYIITNAHAVISSDKKNLCQFVQVHLSDGSIYNAKIVGVDTVTDIAVLKIDANNLPVAVFGSSDDIKVGEKAVAIGNPVGLELAFSVTQGIISGTSRQIEQESTVKYIQTDAPINPGNSGGALINKYGEVIGINTAKIQFYEGIGFAIPINEAKVIIDDIIKNGYVTSRVKIGILYQPIPMDIVDLMGVPKGIRVVSVDESTDAFKQGIKKGDIITHMDTKEITNADDIANIMKDKKANDTINLTILRVANGKSETLNIKVTLQADMRGNIK